MTAGWVAAVAAGATAGGAFVIWLTRLLWHTLQRTIRFLDEFFGEAARDGMPARPGVIARLAALEAGQRSIVAETRPNGGTSLRDVVHRTAADVAVIKDRQAEMKAQIQKHMPPDERNDSR